MASNSDYNASLHRNRALGAQDNPASLGTRRKSSEIHPGNLIGRENRNYFSIHMPGSAYWQRSLSMCMAEIK